MARRKVKAAAEYWPIADLVLLENNPRTIKKADMDKLVKSIKDNPDYFEARPIILSNRTGKNVIIAGNQRLKAAEQLGLKEVPAVLLEGLTEDREREIIIRDNVSNGEWDMDELANSFDIDELKEWGLDLDFTEPEKEIIEDEAPEPPAEPKAKLGDIYKLGEHRLMCGDSTKREDVEKLMGGELADMVFTDPPYNVNYSGQGKVNKLGHIRNDSMDDNNFSNFLHDCFECFYTFMKPLSPIYVCHPDAASAPKIAFETNFAEFFRKSATIIWNKQNASMGWQDYRSQHEPIIYGWKDGEGKHNFYGDRTKTTVWSIKRDDVQSYDHPTQKPLALPAEAIKNSSEENSIVLDLFGGSGSTLMACEQLKRKCYTMELDPKYVDVIVERWENLTGKKAEKVEA